MRQVLLLSAWLSLSGALVARQGGIQEMALLTAADGAPYDSFGDAVAVSADMVVIGSPGHDAAGSAAGAVYVFERDLGGPNAWGLAEKLLSPWQDPQGDRFGQALALDGDTLAVGAPYLDDVDGGVFVYERGPAGFELAAVNVGALCQQLGQSVALEGDRLVAGGPYACSIKWGFIPDERTIIYDRNQGGAEAWGVLQELWISGCEDFGEDVDLDGDTLIIGAPILDYFCSMSGDPGSAYVYSGNSPGQTFSWEAELTLGPDQEGYAFGRTVAIDGQRAAFSGSSQFGSELTGEVRIWEQSSPGGPWQPAARIRGPAESQVPTFGESLLLQGSFLLIGSPATYATAAEPGRVWVYRSLLSGTWSFQGWLYPSDSQPDDQFGRSMDRSGSLLVVGAPGTVGNSYGAAYVFGLGSGEFKEENGLVGVGSAGGW
jgi:hypothetical protein